MEIMWSRACSIAHGRGAGLCRSSRLIVVASSRSRRNCASFSISETRLREFLSAEIKYLADGYSTISVEKILQHRDPASVASAIQKELPARFASRLLQIEETPQWQEIPGMVELNDIVTTSFSNLRLSAPHIKGDSVDELKKFSEVIWDLRARHKRVLPLIVKVMTGLKENTDMSDAKINEWTDKFMNSRMGTEMLTKHYELLLTGTNPRNIGIVDTRCDPALIVRKAIKHVESLYDKNQVRISLHVQQKNIEFSFISIYLLYIIVELLKNSVAASLVDMRRSKDGRKQKVEVSVCANEQQVGIRIRDSAGGLPCDQDDEEIWSYLYTTMPADLQAQFVDGDTLKSPILGAGMGLPLCKLYATYLNGKLDLMSTPGLGTDAYLYIDRIDAAGP